MDEFERVRPTPPIGIWQKQCRNRPGCRWFSESAQSYRKNDAKTTNYCRQNSLGKPQPLLRLSSTGDTVEETAVDFRNFDPANIRGTESSLRPAGIFDRFTKFAWSASNNISRGSSMSLTNNNKLPGKLPAENRVDLNILIEKFDQSKMEMERPGIQNAWVSPAVACHRQQWGMNGFVKEGVYHPFQRQVNSPDRQPSIMGAFLNVRPSNHQAHNNRHETHPYPRWNQHLPKRHPFMNSYSISDHLDFISCNPLLASPGKPQSHRAKITNSTIFRNKFVDPKSQPQMQSPKAFGYKEVKGHHEGHRNHVMKQQPMMSHRKNRNKVSTMPNTGNSNQLNTRKSNRSNKNLKHTSCSSLKTEKPRTVSGCFLPKSPEHINNANALNHSDEKVVGEEMVKQLVKGSNDNGQQKQELKVDVKGQTELKANQAEELELNIASSVLDERWEKCHHEAAEPEINQGKETKSNNKETSSTTQTTPCDENKELCVSNTNTRNEEFSIPQDKSSNDLSTNHDSTPSSKPLHASLAYILAETIRDDVSDSDWDVEESPPTSDTWNFLDCWNDPYNPLYGWKCESYSTKQATPEPVKHDSSLRDDELDSGIFSLQAQQDEADNVSDKDSENDAWNNVEDSTNISKSSEKCLTALRNSINSVTDEIKQTSLNKVQSQEVEDFNITVKPSDNSSNTNNETDKNILSLPSKSSTLHPSVLFILGIDETDSDDDDDDDYDDDDFDSCSSDLKRDVSWDPIQRIHDPFNPLQGWKCTLTTTPAKSPATACPISITCTDSSLKPINFSENNDSFQDTTDSIQETVRRMSATTAPSKVVSKPTLKHAASTGCLRNLSEKWRSGSSNVVKKVHFCDGSPTFISPEVPMWMSEYCASRKGPWEEMARDRCRFMHRIRTTEGMIGGVFESKHRERVQKRLGAY